MKLHRMPSRMTPMTLQRGPKSIMLRAGQVPKMDGAPVELALSELAQLRKLGIVPNEEPEPRPFAAKPKILLSAERTIAWRPLDTPAKDMFDEIRKLPKSEPVEIEQADLGDDESEGNPVRREVKAQLDSEGWDMIGLPDAPVSDTEDTKPDPEPQPLARIKPKRVPKSEARD